MERYIFLSASWSECTRSSAYQLFMLCNVLDIRERRKSEGLNIFSAEWLEVYWKADMYVAVTTLATERK
jgi:hypothetical protein